MSLVYVIFALRRGSASSVDSSELAFRTAGRVAMAEALTAATPYLLEPLAHVTIRAPGSAVSGITSAATSRRGQVLGIAPLEGWSRWDVIALLLPEAELPGLEPDLRSLSQGMAHYEARFDHLAELSEKLASALIQRTPEPPDPKWLGPRHMLIMSHRCDGSSYRSVPQPPSYC